MRRKMLAVAAATVVAATLGTAGTAAAAPTGTVATRAGNWVQVTAAHLRSSPTMWSTRLDTARYGQGIDLYCWRPGADSSPYVWFFAHPWGSRHAGWMRADLVHNGTYPHPSGRC